MMKPHRSGGHSALAVAAAVSLALAAFSVQTAVGKSLYLIKDLNDDGPVQAYDIGLTPGSPVLQRESGPIGFGPVGMAVDDASGTLFITIEGRGAVWLMDAVTLRMLGSVATPRASNLAGVAFDSATQQLYAVDRNSNQLYVYTWDPTCRVLAYYQTVALPEVSGAMGLAWDEADGLLLVADAATKTVRCFYPADWTEARRFTITQKPMGIAVDSVRRLVYTGNALIAKGQPSVLSQYDLSTGTEKVFNLRTLPGLDAPSDCVVGLAADTGTGYVYITTGNQVSGGTSCLMVFDSSLHLLYTSPRLGNPTGICIPNNDLAYNPLHLANSDGVPPGSSVLPGGQITYTLSYDNLSGASPVNNVVLRDILAPGTAFLSASGGGTYDPATHTVTWTLGQLPAGASRSSQTVIVRVTASGGALLSNRCQITSTETGPAFATALTPVGGDNMPPVAIAGLDQRVEQTSAAGAPVTLDASGSYDPEGDHLTYLWSWAEGNETGPQVTRTFPLGTTTITLIVSDGTSTSEPDTVTVTVVDTTPPRLTVPADVTAEQTSYSGTPVSLGTPMVADACDAAVQVTNDAPALFPLGVTTVTWTAADASGNVTTATQKVTIVDTTPPTITSAWATPNVLWPASHEMVPVTIGLLMKDICDAAPAWKIESVASSEPLDGKGDSNTPADWEITGAHTLRLRAERSGNSNTGRVYTITLRACDASGNSSSAIVTVTVPHDQGTKSGKK